jgi:hypothetical protein
MRSPRLPAILAVLACVLAGPVRAQPSAEFGDPQPVSILGYDGDVMEPFLSRDGKCLFFNNRNDPRIDTNLFWAERIDALAFRFLGPLPGANSHDLDAVASMDRAGGFYFVSSRDYAATGALIHRGRFHDGRVDDVAVVQGLASKAHPGFNFDAEISADGSRLYYVESQRGAHRSRLAIADRQAGGFVREAGSDDLLREVNGSGLVYAPAVSADGLELFFTRAAPRLAVLLDEPKIYEARRRRPDQPFGPPVRIAAIGGYAEAPTISPDGLSLYYHALTGGRFRLYRVTRRARPVP